LTFANRHTWFSIEMHLFIYMGSKSKQTAVEKLNGMFTFGNWYRKVFEISVESLSKILETLMQLDTFSYIVFLPPIF